MIGIITLSFNQAPFLPEAIASVSGQKQPEDCYVVVDPGSTDGSRELLDARRPDIDVLLLEPDSGPADGLNKGIAACAKCEIVGYINADDRLAPGALPFVRKFFADHPETDVLLGSIRLIDAVGQSKRRARVCDSVDLRRYAIGACNLFQQGTFFRRRACLRAGGFNTSNVTCWDSELLVDLALTGARFSNTTRILGEFRVHGDSITGSGRLRSRYLKDQIRICRKIQAAGVPPYPAWQAAIIRALHRANPIRQASYLLAS